MQKRIAEKSLGTVTIMNTDHGRTAYVEREQFSNQRPQWTVAVVCNGVAEYSKKFRSRLDALVTFESLA